MNQMIYHLETRLTLHTWMKHYKLSSLAFCHNKSAQIPSQPQLPASAGRWLSFIFYLFTLSSQDLASSDPLSLFLLVWLVFEVNHI